MAQNQSAGRKRCYNAENGAMLFARLAPRRSVDLRSHPIIAESLQPGSILEIDGPVASGKTSILIDVAARCILPTSAGGLELNVAFVDCDGQFHISRLITVIERALTDQSTSPAAASAPAIDDGKVTESLARFHYVACDCSEDFLQSFDLLDSAICAAPITDDSGGWILLIDGINAFYWLDRTSSSRANVNQVQQNYARRVNRFLTEHNIPAVATKLAVEAFQDEAQEATAAGKSENGSSPKIAVSCSMDFSWRKLINNSIQLSVVETGGRRMHKAVRGNSNVVHFEVARDGISYVG